MKYSIRGFAVTAIIVTSTIGFTTSAIGASKEKGSSNGQPFQALQAQIDQTKADLDALAASNGAAILSLQTDVAELQSQIGGLQAQIDSNDAGIANLQTATGDNASDIADLEAANVGLQSQIDDLESEIDTKQDVLNGGGCTTGYALRVIYPGGGYLCEFVNANTTTYVSRLVSVGSFVYMRYQNTQYGAAVNCPSGYFATGGGANVHWGGSNRVTAIIESRPNGNGWYILGGLVPNNAANYIQAVAMCIKNYH